VTRGFGTADATTESFSYNTAGKLLSSTDGNGHKTTYGYDAEGNRTSEKDAEGNETKWTFNGAHDVLSMTMPGGETTTIKRDGQGNPETISRPGPEETTQVTSYGFTEFGELESIIDPLKRTWSYGYNSNGDRTSVEDPEGNTRTAEYDGDSRLIAITNPRGNAEGVEPAKFTTTVERDLQGRPVKTTDPLGGTTKYSYDGNGNVEAKTNANGHVTKFVYSGDNEVTKVEKPNGAVRETSYDGAGNITSQTDPEKGTTTYVRNIVGQPIEVIDPLKRKSIQKFDDAGNLETVIDPEERETTYGYDDSDRLTKVSYSEGATPDVEYGYDPNGAITKMVDGTGESVLSYDELGRLSSVENGYGDLTGFGYDLAEQLTAIQYPNGKSITRSFDNAGRLESISDWLGGTTTFAYDPDSNLVSIAFPVGTGNVDEYSFDRADRMSGADFFAGEMKATSLSYGRDALGQLEEVESTGLPGAGSTSYEYDQNERLIGAGEASYEYDLRDNLTNAPGRTNSYDAGSQLEAGTGVGYSYDGNGQRSEVAPESGPATSYSYDQAGNLTSIERPEEGEVAGIGMSFTYDGQGLMASQTKGLATNHLTWDLSGPMPLLLDDGENSYVYGPDGLPVLQISKEEGATYLHHDQLGSTRMLTDSAGETTASFSFTPYGALEGSTGTATSPMGFAGQYTESESGLQYLRARFYDPATAQFLTVDPISAHTHAPYAYGKDNPLSFVDPSGLGACILGFIDCDETDDPCDPSQVVATNIMLPACLVSDDAADTVSDVTAGFGDGASFGWTQKAREALGESEPDDTCSLLYDFSNEFGSLFRDFTITVAGTPALRYFPVRVKPQVPRDLPPRYQSPPRDLDPVP
jgi:RHS repeat-associated protein